MAMRKRGGIPLRSWIRRFTLQWVLGDAVRPVGDAPKFTRTPYQKNAEPVSTVSRITMHTEAKQRETEVCDSISSEAGIPSTMDVLSHQRRRGHHKNSHGKTLGTAPDLSKPLDIQPCTRRGKGMHPGAVFDETALVWVGVFDAGRWTVLETRRELIRSDPAREISQKVNSQTA